MSTKLIELLLRGSEALLSVHVSLVGRKELILRLIFNVRAGRSRASHFGSLLECGMLM